ncbi:MAG: PTS sugar transporter subunit IIA [Rhodothermales bacterium]|nr:PTS sugar transporter subunit IIA [Rhodothermales bacterium]
MSATGSLHIAELLKPEAVRIGLPGTEKAVLIDALVDLLDTYGDAVIDLARVRADVHDREAQMSTGVGKGLALPHARSAAVRDTVAAFATTAEPVEFGAIDGSPVRLVFLLVGPEMERSRHIKLLSRVSRLMNRDAFRKGLLAARTSEEALALFRDAEAALAA